jgi:ribonuclease HI
MNKKCDVVRLHSDASFSAVTNRGTYCWILDIDGEYIKSSGMFKDTAKSSSETETMSIANALYALYDLNVDMKEVVIYCDNTNTIKWIDHKYYNQRSSRVVHQYITMLKNNRGLKKVTCIKVKAHTGDEDYASIMNDFCDRECKRWFKIVRQKYHEYSMKRYVLQGNRRKRKSQGQHRRSSK